MIIIDWKSLNSIGQEYVKRLMDFAAAHPRSYLKTKILDVLGPVAFRDLILCPPHRLENYPCPAGLNPQDVYGRYDSFFGADGNDGVNNADWLLQMLNISVCPYCNRTYTFTIKGKDGVRPELDHFFPRSDDKFKHLALSFYNLVPSCPACNHTKNDEIFDFHPYYGMLNGPGLKPTFRIKNAKGNNGVISFPDNPDITIDNQNKNTGLLRLEPLYKKHAGYAKEILDKIQAYNASSYSPLIASFQGMSKTPEEIDRLIWGNYIDDAGENKRPLSKLTRDILKQYGII